MQRLFGWSIIRRGGGGGLFFVRGLSGRDLPGEHRRNELHLVCARPRIFRGRGFGRVDVLDLRGGALFGRRELSVRRLRFRFAPERRGGTNVRKLCSRSILCICWAECVHVVHGGDVSAGYWCFKLRGMLVRPICDLYWFIGLFRLR